MNQPSPKFQEEYSAKIPALTLLINLGWTFLSPQDALTLRNDKKDQVVLKTLLKEVLNTRRFLFEGTLHALNDKSIDTIISEVCNPALNQGLLKANEQLYNHMLYGITISQFIDGKKATPHYSLN